MRRFLTWFLILASVSIVQGDDTPAALIRSLEPLIVRGVNYYPRATPWGAMWTQTPPGVFDRDLALAATLGINTIRTFVPFGPPSESAGLLQADGSLTPAYQAKIESLLAAAWASRIRVILCLEFAPQWLARTNAAAYWQHSVADLVGAHRHDGRVLLWDLMNEPDDPPKWNDGTRAYLQASLPFVRQLDPDHLTTIGLAWRGEVLRETGLSDVMQYPLNHPNESHFGLVRADGTFKPAAAILKETYQRWSRLDATH